MNLMDPAGQLLGEVTPLAGRDGPLDGESSGRPPGPKRLDGVHGTPCRRRCRHRLAREDQQPSHANHVEEHRAFSRHRRPPFIELPGLLGALVERIQDYTTLQAFYTQGVLKDIRNSTGNSKLRNVLRRLTQRPWLRVGEVFDGLEGC